ncbi:Structural maintenance of chromosomes flexible hinge domain-containing protein GMI1, partial [Bienertia sinuspersici]
MDVNAKKRKFKNDATNDGDLDYRFNVLLPNGISVPIIRRNPVNDSISLEAFLQKVKDKCSVILKKTEGSSARRKVFWNSKELYLEDIKGNKMRSKICYDKFKPNKTHILKLFNMWDLTPDTDLLTELPDDYTVEIDEDEVSVFDTGPGMDGSDENSIVKWGKMGASVHRSSKKLAIGGKPPYLTPFFGMFGYGGTIASMHLGRHAVVSAKTKESKEVYWLRLERDALLKRSGSHLSWKAAGGIRDPTDSEIEMSPHGSFTKIVMKPKLKFPDIFQLQCKLKDIYFPYIQCDEISNTGRTTTLVEFQINGINLAEIEGGEVAVTNLHSCNGPEFVLNLNFTIEEDKAASKSPSVRTVREGNARLKCVYFPVFEGKESIERILDKLNADGFDIKEDYETFSRISIRRLGRLLPDARWELLPFMKPKQKRGAKLQTLKTCCSRVKCFIDTDAGFNPIPSKTDLAPQHPFTKALKDLGGDTHQKEKVVNVQISKGGKQLTPQQLEREYQNWIFQMHSQYDDECNLGDDEPIWLTSVSNKEALHVTSDVVRVHKVISRKGKSWHRGQKVKILKGACAGCHKSNIFATLEYFLLEGCEKDTGGEARIICRPLGVNDEDGSTMDDTGTSLELHSSLSLPIIAIDSGKCIAVNDDEWNCQAEKLNLKLPSMIEVLGPEQTKALDIYGALPTDASVSAGSLPPKEIVAVLRPLNFSPSSNANDLDQKYIIRDNFEMCLDIKYKAEAAKCSKMDQIFSGTATNTSRNGISGLYIFSVDSIPNLFQKAGAYSFSFTLKNSTTISCEKTVRVKALSKVKRWELSMDGLNLPLSVSAGSAFPSFSVSRYDEHDNIIPFTRVPEIEAKLLSIGVVLSHIKNVKVELSLDLLHVTVSNLRIATNKLDDIRPSYKAVLALSQPDRQPFLRVPCLVFPGPIKSVHLHSSETNKELLPKQVLEDIRLEMLDRHQNHVNEGVEVELELYGFCFLDQIGVKRKIDGDGFLDLSGLLKVTEGYGKLVSLSVKSNTSVILTKKFQVEKRELRMGTKVPELCHPGSKLKDIAFEVVNSKGQIDQAIHDDDKQGKSHTLRILTGDSDPLRYAFRQGRCVIPSITLPQEEGTFCIEAFHSQHQELRVKFEVNISRSSHTEHDMTSDLQASEEEMMPLQKLQSSGLIQSAEKEIHELASSIKNEEDVLEWSKLRRVDINEELTQLQAAIEVLPQPISQLDGMFQKEVVLEYIEYNKVDSAASIYNSASQKMSLEIRYPEFSADVVGLVALLATAPTPLLSRTLAEYLGEDHMLGIVCQSSAALKKPEIYENILLSLASDLERSFKGRQLIICLEDIRQDLYYSNYSNYIKAFHGEVLDNDCHRKLDLTNPALPNGTTPPGFLGYAVYETKEHMKHARECITEGAVSLDGGIIKGKGMISLGSKQVGVHFPVAAEESESSNRERITKEIEAKKQELIALDQIITSSEKTRESYLKAFREKEVGLIKLFEEHEATQKVILSQQSIKTTPMAPFHSPISTSSSRK